MHAIFIAAGTEHEELLPIFCRFLLGSLFQALVAFVIFTNEGNIGFLLTCLAYFLDLVCVIAGVAALIFLCETSMSKNNLDMDTTPWQVYCSIAFMRKSPRNSNCLCCAVQKSGSGQPGRASTRRPQAMVLSSKSQSGACLVRAAAARQLCRCSSSNRRHSRLSRGCCFSKRLQTGAMQRRAMQSGAMQGGVMQWQRGELQSQPGGSNKMLNFRELPIPVWQWAT